MTKQLTASAIAPYAFATPGLAAEHEAAIGRMMQEAERAAGHVPGVPPVPQLSKPSGRKKEAGGNVEKLVKALAHGEWRQQDKAFAMEAGINPLSLWNFSQAAERRGLVETQRRQVGRRMFTWVRITDAGREMA
ncbi:MAG: hypothetical protein ACQEUZ_06255 [Pseudomonadota bacterium]